MEGAEKVVAGIKADSGRAIAVKGDVGKSAEVQALFDETKKAFGKVDILVNNAGIYRFDPIEDVTEDKFHRLFNTYVLGTLLATREAVKHFGNDGGSVIKQQGARILGAPLSGACILVPTLGQGLPLHHSAAAINFPAAPGPFNVAQNRRRWQRLTASHNT